MAFHDFSSYIFQFPYLDQRMEHPADQKKYYDRWMKKYGDRFAGDDETMTVIEWDLRCRKALRGIFSSATFFIEARKDLQMRCFSSYYFCLYYALFHAVYAAVFLDADSDFEKLLHVTHKNIIHIFISAYANSKTDILTKEIGAVFEDLRYRREYYSYVTPFNNLFRYEEDLKTLQNILLECYQLTGFHSLMISKSFRKKIRRVVKFKDADEIYEFDRMFHQLFSKKAPDGKSILDASCEFMRYEMLRDGFCPEYIALDLDHQFDEFHTYDGYYDGGDETNAIKASDIWSFVAQALM